MWLGKLALVSYLFSIILFGVGYMMHEALGVTLFQDHEGNNTATAEYIEAFTIKHEVDPEVNPAFIFGDFVSGLKIIGGIISSTFTGGVIGDAFSRIPFIQEGPIQFLLRALITFSTLCLGVNIVTGRNL